MRRCQQLPLRIEISAAGRSECQELCPGVSNQAARWCNGRLRPVLAIVSLTICAVFFDVLFLGSYFCFRDSANYFPGIYRLVRDSWASGEVPLWNPLLNGGQPLAALNVAAVFYPLQVIAALVLPAGTDVNVSTILHIVLAGCAAFTIARDRRCSIVAAATAALSYAGCGCIFFHVYSPNMLAGAVWFAWSMRYGLLLLRSFSPLCLLFFSASLALAVLAGDPQAVFHAAICLGFQWLVHLASAGHAGRRHAVRAAGTLLAGGLLAGALALVQIMLTQEFMATTTRCSDSLPLSLWAVPRFLAEAAVEERSSWCAAILGRAANVNAFYDEVYRFSVAPWRLLECLSPLLSGPFLDRWPARTSLEGELSWVATLYAGIVPLGSVAVALWNFRRKPSVRGWAVILVFAYLASLGGFGACGLVRHIAQRLTGINPPIFYEHGDEVGGVYWFLVTFVPGYEGFRYPAKWLTPFGLAFSQLAAIGFQDFVRAAGTHRRLLPAGIVLAAAATAVAAAAAGPQAPDVILGGAVTIVLAFVACVILRRAAHAPSDHAALRSSAHLLLCVTAIDLVVAARFNMYNAPFAALSEGGAAIARLQADRLPTMASVNPTPRLAAIDGRNTILTTASAVDLAKQTGLLMRGNTPLVHHWGKYGEPGTAMEADFELLCSPVPHGTESTFPRRTFDMASVEFFVVSTRAVLEDSEALMELRRAWTVEQRDGQVSGITPEGSIMPVLQASVGDRPVAIYIRNDSALPRARIVRNVRRADPVPARPRSRRLAFLFDIAFPNARLPSIASTAVVESVTPLPELGPPPAGGDAKDSCHIVTDAPRHVVIEANLAAAGLVILADTFHPDWHLRVASDGSEPRVMPILRVNRVQRGCLLPAGKHRLEYRHRSVTFERGAVVSSTAWLAILATAAAICLCRRKPVV